MGFIYHVKFYVLLVHDRRREYFLQKLAVREYANKLISENKQLY